MAQPRDNKKKAFGTNGMTAYRVICGVCTHFDGPGMREAGVCTKFAFRVNGLSSARDCEMWSRRTKPHTGATQVEPEPAPIQDFTDDIEKAISALTPARAKLARLVIENPGISLPVIAEALGLGASGTSSTIMKANKVLAKSGWIIRGKRWAGYAFLRLEDLK